MVEDKTQIAALLAREYPFHSLTPEELLSLAYQFSIIELKPDELIATPEHPVMKFYVVYSGRLQVDLPVQRRKIYRTELGAGDYFGDEYLINGKKQPATIKALEPVVLLSLDLEPFSELLNAHPEIRTIISTTLHSRRMARSPRFSWINPDETVFYIGRKHWFFLIRSLILPIFLLVFSVTMIAIGLTGSTFILFFGGSLFLFGLFLFVVLWLDWGNDYYIVTGQRVVWIEKIILLYDSRDEAPLYNVLAVDVYTTWFGHLLDYGDVSARTYTGSIPMKKASTPFVLASYVEGLRKRSEAIVRVLEEQQMQAALAEALQKKKAPGSKDIIPDIPPPLPFKAPKKKSAPKKSENILSRWQTFLKVRYEQNGVITYRKSIAILVFKLFWPLLLLLLWAFGMVMLFRGQSTDGFNGFVLTLMLFSLAGLLFWLWYQYTDWKNDIYRLTPTQIFDIERRPLGAERKKTADLENILTITHSRNFWGILFNFGNVIITVGETQFIFLDVYNPDRVHQDIANYQEALRQHKRKATEARERERMINWLVAYDLESQKLE